MDNHEPALLGVSTIVFNQSIQQKLPSLRQRFLAGLQDAQLIVRIPLESCFGKNEMAWVRILSWQEPLTLTGVLESQPPDCAEVLSGNPLSFPARKIQDFALIGTEYQVISTPADAVAGSESNGQFH